MSNFNTTQYNINPETLYQYSIFFRNYLHNVAEDVMKNGILLEYFNRSGDIDALAVLKVELKNALQEAIVSYRFFGVGYVLIKTADDISLFENEVNNEIPTGFMYLDYNAVTDYGYDNEYISYTIKITEDNNITHKSLKIHKSRVIVYANYDTIVGSYMPCYTQSFLLSIYLFELIYKELEKRLPKHNFIFYKDESLAEIQDAINNSNAQMGLLTRIGDNVGSLFAKLVGKQDNDSIQSTMASADRTFIDQFENMIKKLNNSGFYVTGKADANMELIKYDIAYLKGALELVKTKIGADTKEPLTRSFNEQVKGLGSDGKGDRSNYYDFLKTLQEKLEIQCNLKFNQYYGLDMRFNSLVMLNDIEKIEYDMKVLELYKQLKELKQNVDPTDEDFLALNAKLFNPVSIENLVDKQNKNNNKNKGVIK